MMKVYICPNCGWKREQQAIDVQDTEDAEEQMKAAEEKTEEICK